MKNYGYKVTLKHERFELRAKIPYKDKLQAKFEFMVANRDAADEWIAVIKPQLGVCPQIDKKDLEIPTGEAKSFVTSVSLRAQQRPSSKSKY